MPLIIAGLGIKFLSHLTKETEIVIAKSEKILYLANDALFSEWIENKRKNTESLEKLYFSFSNRSDSYEAISQKILSELEIHNDLCFLVYGHPNFLVQITSLLVNIATKKHEVYILPAISSLDCLLADLCINPGDSGMQLYEATELIIHKRMIDILSHVIIFQPSAVGQKGHIRDKEVIKRGLIILFEYLSSYYSDTHEIVVYEASQYPNSESKITRVTLKQLPKTKISSKSTIYIPPSRKNSDSKRPE